MHYQIAQAELDHSLASMKQSWRIIMDSIYRSPLTEKDTVHFYMSGFLSYIQVMPHLTWHDLDLPNAILPNGIPD